MKKRKTLISILGGLYGTALIYSFFYFFITANITYLFYLGIPFFSLLIGSVIYINLKDSDNKDE